ncbi:MAG: DUF1800 domain-containing protein [Herpetosiphon sp.]
MALSRRTFLKGAAVALAAAGLPTWAATALYAKGRPTPLFEYLMEEVGVVPSDYAVHVVNRATFGATAAEVERVRALGVAAFIDEQLNPEKIDDGALEARLEAFPTLSMSGTELHALTTHQASDELRQATMLRAIYSRRQLQEVLVDFWSNHFNVFIEKGDCRFLKTIEDRDVIRPHVFGHFRQLLGASAHSPAMLVYLDNRLNRKLAPNENYGRELMELHTLSVDGGYSEADVAEVARCFTGWTIRDNAFYFDAKQHDQSAKTVLGVLIPPAGGIEDGEKVLDMLATHPQTAHFIATKLCRRFVVDQPPSSLVNHIASVFKTTNGDLRQVMSAILTTPEIAASGGQKFRRPFDFIAAAARAIGAETDGQALGQHCANMEQPLFGAPFPTGYPDVGGAWINTFGLLSRWRLALGLAAGQVNHTRVTLDQIVGTATDPPSIATSLITALLPGVPVKPLADHLATLIAAGGLKPSQRKQSIAVAAGLIMAAPVFQRR